MTGEGTGRTPLDAVTTRGSSVGCPLDAPRGLIPALTILYHPRLERVGERAILGDIALRDAICLSRMEPGFGLPGGSEGAPLKDAHLSRKPLRLIALPEGRVRLDVAENRARTVVEGVPLEGSRDFSHDEMVRGVVIELSDRVILLLHLLDPSPPEPRDRLGLIGENYLLERVRRDIHRIADHLMPVLIRGETGTGKELVARGLHHASARREQPFVAVNMGAITPSLAAAELFGAERGAYTGAVLRQPGYFEKAEGGTLFLDEIGEALPDVQVMLLRALETGEIQAVGARAPRTVSVRLVTATDANLEAKIVEGAFREPLFHRMAGVEIVLPPLRDRRDDIGRLLVHFAREELERLEDARRLESPGPDGKPWLPASLVARLVRHDWSGNVRQLRNLVQQLVVRHRGAPHLPEGPALERLLRQLTPLSQELIKGAGWSAAEPHRAESVDAQGHSSSAGRSGGSGWRRPSDVSEGELLSALRQSRWDLKAAALLLRVSRTSLYAMVESCPRVRRAGDLAPEEIADCFRVCGGDIDRMVDRLEVSKRALLRRIRELRLG